MTTQASQSPHPDNPNQDSPWPSPQSRRDTASGPTQPATGVTRLDTWKRRLLARTEAPDQLARSRLRYLPAALEVERTPANPIGRALMWAIVVLFVIALLWALIGKLDVVAVAQGTVVPSGQSKTIQPMALGRVAAIHVQEGDRVQKGDPLITLDGTLTTADWDKLRHQLATRELQLARQRAFSQALPAPGAPNAGILLQQPAPTLAVPERLYNHPRFALEQALLQGQWDELATQVQTLAAQQQAKQAERAAVTANITRLERLLPLQQEKTRAQETLLAKNLSARAQWMEAQQGLIELEETRNAERQRQAQLSAEIAQLQSQRRQLLAQTRRQALQAQEELHTQVDALRQDLIKARARHQQQTLTAPLDGTVQQLAVHTLGGVVQPAEPVMHLVPADAKLQVQAWVLNKDIGFVQPGQAAQVKVDTYNFTKYGLIPGTVRHLSPDAVPDEKLGPRYLAIIELNKNALKAGKKPLNLAPGMTVSAEIMTGQRRIIDYFLSPIQKAVGEAFREM